MAYLAVYNKEINKLLYHLSTSTPPYRSYITRCNLLLWPLCKMDPPTDLRKTNRDKMRYIYVLCLWCIMHQSSITINKVGCRHGRAATVATETSTVISLDYNLHLMRSPRNTKRIHNTDLYKLINKYGTHMQFSRSPPRCPHIVTAHIAKSSYLYTI